MDVLHCCITSRVLGAKCRFPGFYLLGQSFSPSDPALHVPTPLRCLRPGSFQSTMSSGHTWHVVQGFPCGPYSSDWPLVLPLPQDQGCRVCHAPET